MLRPDSRLCILALLLIAIVAVAPAATNSPFFTDEFTETRWNCQNMAPDATNWWVNGTMTVVNQSGCQGSYQSIIGVSAVGTDSGSMIFKGSVPTGADQEIRGKVKISPTATSGRFSLYLDATNDARYNSPLSATGSGYVVRFVINSFYSDATQKTGDLSVHRFGAGYPSIVQLASTTATLKLDSTIRATRSYSNGTWRVLVHVDDKFLLSVADATITSGKPGLGFTDASSASDAYWDRVEIATIEHGAPDMTSLPTSIQFSATPGYVAIQWPPMPDTSGGSSYGASGISRYNVYRNGALRGTVILDASGDILNYFYDSGVTANTLYTYKIRAYDRHNNYAEASANVTTPAGTGTAVSMLPRRVGQPVNASSWGSGGENVDLLSGNLNYIHPVLTAAGRNGYSAPLMLSYNAQNFVKENGVEFPVRHSVGYGFGWKMQFGAIRRVPETGPTVSYYVFEDATGAEYPLDVLSGVATWKPSGFSPILDFNAAGNVVHFKDGSFWNMECVSAANEFDKGTRYPTVLQHPNGNRIYVRYYAGSGASWPNSSARIHEIEDVRAQGSNPRWTYRFTYSASPSGHLATIANNIGSGEQYTFSYSPSPLPLYSPYSPQLPYATDTFLNAIATEAGQNVTSFTYSANNSGELTRVTFPYGGTIDYTYTSAN